MTTWTMEHPWMTGVLAFTAMAMIENVALNIIRLLGARRGKT